KTARELGRRKVPRNDDLAVGLNAQRKNRIWECAVEVRVEAAVRIQARKIAAQAACNGGEPAPNQKFSIGHGAQYPSHVVRAGVEALIQASISIQASNPRARLSADHREQSAHEYFAVRLDRQAVNRII